MATMTGDEVTVASTATQVVAANAARRSLLLRVTNGEVWVGPTNGVTVEGGYYMNDHDDPVVDNVPALGDVYAIARAGTATAKMSYMEITD